MRRFLSLLFACVLILGCAAPVSAHAAGTAATEPPVARSPQADAPVIPVTEGDFPASALTAEDIPMLTTIAVAVLNDNYPEFSVKLLTTEEYVILSPLDAYGRTGAALACLGPDTLVDEARPAGITLPNPAGFDNNLYPDLIGGNHYVYNRSHVIAYSLCGIVDDPRCLFTGTAFLNTDCMKPYETAIKAHIRTDGCHVIYRVTPIYRDNELVPYGVQLEAWSVEDRGELSFNVFIYNIQPGVTINYTDGSNSATKHYKTVDYVIPVITACIRPEQDTEAASPVSPDGEAAPSKATPGDADVSDTTYILNTNSMKFHYTYCEGAAKISGKNRLDTTLTREEVVALGYTPCGICNP